MRFMMMVLSEGSGSAANDGAPCAEGVATMMAYTTSLQRAGVLLARDGLFPPSTGARIAYTDGTPTVTDGPFAESNAVIDRYWIIQARSREEAIEWAKRAPMSETEVIEVRQIHEESDVPDNVRTAVEGFEHPTR